MAIPEDSDGSPVPFVASVPLPVAVLLYTKSKPTEHGTICRKEPPQPRQVPSAEPALVSVDGLPFGALSVAPAHVCVRSELLHGLIARCGG